MQRLTKEYSLNINRYIGVKYGSVDKINPRVVYLTCKSWLCPKYDGEYIEPLNEIMRKFKNNVKLQICNNPFLDNRFVFDFDLKTASLRENKKNFVTFEIYLKQNVNRVLRLKEIREELENMFTNVFNDLTLDFNRNTFELSKSKH